MSNQTAIQDDNLAYALIAHSGTADTAVPQRITSKNVLGALDVYNVGPAGTTTVAPNLPIIAGTPADPGTFVTIRLTDGTSYYNASGGAGGGSNVNVFTGTLQAAGTVTGVGVVTSITNLVSGTLLSAGTVTGVGTVTNIGSFTNGGTIKEITNIAGGTITTTLAMNTGTITTIVAGTQNTLGTVGTVPGIGIVTALAVGTVGGKAASGAVAVANPVQIAGTDSGGTIYSPLVTTGGQITGTTTGVGVVTSITNVVSGTLLSAGTVTGVGVVSNLTNGSVNILTGTLQSAGTVTGVGVVTSITNLVSGTLLSAGTVTGVGTVTNLGSLTNAGTIKEISNIAGGSVIITTGTVVRNAAAATAGSFTAAGTINALGSTFDAISVDIGGTWVGTVFFEGQSGTSAWFALDSVKQGGVVGTQTIGNGDFFLNAPGLSGVRARVTYASGTLTYNSQTTPFQSPAHYALGGSISNLGSFTNGGTVTAVTTVSNLTNGSVNILTGTLQSSGTTTGVGVVSNLTNGSVNILTGTLQSAGTVTGVGVVSNLTNGSVNILTGTLQSAGTVTGIGTVPGIGSLTNMGTLSRFGYRPAVQVTSFGTVGTAGGSFFGTISAASGAGTVQIVSGVDIVCTSGTPQVLILFGSALTGGSVLAQGAFPPGGGISKQFSAPIESGTNSEIMYHFVGAGTARISTSFWKTV